MVESAIAFSITVIVVISLISAGLYLLVYFGLKSFKSWARVLGMVFAITGLVFVIGGSLFDGSMLATSFGLISLVVTLAWAGVTIYWLILAFSTPVRDHLDMHRR